MMIAIIDYKAGNLTSVARAVESLGFDCRITREGDEILSADRVIFPGVGAAGAAMADLKSTGMDKILKTVFENNTPLLGICLGTQIILEHSDEDGGVDCLGLIPGQVRRFSSDMYNNDARLKVPHMGWNSVEIVNRHPVMEGYLPEHEFYFVHSYYPVPGTDSSIIARTGYGREFASIIGTGSLVAVQFHLEKSGRPGLNILKNFCNWDGKNA